MNLIFVEYAQTVELGGRCVFDIVTKSSTCDTLKTTGREMWGENFVVSRIICIFAAENVN